MDIILLSMIFLPLTIIPFKWREFENSDWCFNVFYLMYSLALITTSDLPQYHRITSFYIGIPMIAYIAYLFPEWQDHYPDKVIKIISFTGLTVTFIALIAIF